MDIEIFTFNDIDNIGHLQPEGWPDIVPDFEFYLKSTFCYPIKIQMDNRIVGVGTSIVFKNSSWIAHIIVDFDYRNRGIGKRIVDELLENNKKHSISTCSLIATDLGKLVYVKAGFKELTAYKFLKRESEIGDLQFDENIVGFQERFRKDIYQLDKYISGEDRENLISYYLLTSKIYVTNNKVCGYYIPDLKEGLIYADDEQAGIELMKLKYSQKDKAVIPSNNLVGLDFLYKIGFVDTGKTATRMFLGDELDWKPMNIYSRIGGNFG